MKPTGSGLGIVRRREEPDPGARSHAAGLPLKKGRAATMTHDYKRHGTTTLFAALDVKSGIVIGECRPRHRAKEFIRFLRRIDRCVRKHLDIHLVLDNYGTHKTPEVKGVARQAPALQAGLHADERILAQSGRALLREITTKRIRRGVFRSIADLERAIHDYLDRHNANPKPFVWTKSARSFSRKAARARPARGYQGWEPTVRLGALAPHTVEWQRLAKCRPSCDRPKSEIPRRTSQ